MNKKELIKYFEDLPYVSVTQMGKKAFIDMIEQLDEPQKPVVPQFVHKYIREARECSWDFQDLFKYIDDEDSEELQKWFYHECNQETLAIAWINGYEVEKEKRYLVKIIGVSKLYECLNFDTTENRWKFFDCDNTKTYRTHHTRKELEEAGFGEVFSSPLFEVEEVEE